MRLVNLTLSNYRNFRHLDLALPQGLVVLHGDNGQGKSNLLEAIYLLAIAKSYRALSEKELVSWETAREGGSLLACGVVQTADRHLDLRFGLDCSFEPGTNNPLIKKKILVNGIPRRSLDLVGLLSAVLFSANDIDLVYGSPQNRRRYLDVLLSQLGGSYLQRLQRYNRVLAQRNHLLRSIREGHAADTELIFWDQALCVEGSMVLQARSKALAQLVPLAQEVYSRLTGAVESIELEYLATVQHDQTASPKQIELAFANTLESSRKRDLALGMTVVGPHRDDLKLRSNLNDMARHSSRGQARLASLALRLAEAQLLMDQRGEAPIMLLDDVLSELDTRRQQLVLAEINHYPQIVLTTTDEHLIKVPLEHQAHRLLVKNSQVIPSFDRKVAEEI